MTNRSRYACRESPHDVRIILLAVLIAAWPATNLSAEGPLLSELVETGVLIPPETTIRLPRPVVAEGNAEQLDPLVGRIGWKRFTKNSVVAPVWMDLNYVKDAEGQRVGHSVHFRFVVHASFNELSDQDMVESVFADQREESDEVGRSREVPESDLIQHGITVDPETNYAWIEVPLMNRLKLRGLLETQVDRNEDASVTTWRLRKALPKPFNATWTPLRRNDLGRKVEGEVTSYQGAGGYISIQSLRGITDELADACLVEGRLVLHEPAGWFGGSNFLRSKFPILIQEAVRKFRRGLAKDN